MKFNFSVPQISKKREDFNFDHSHVLTHNFGVTEVISAIDVKPNDDITIDLSAFTRLMPLPCPTYGGVKITHRAYFVPFDFVMRHFADFIALQKVPAFDTNNSGEFGPSTSLRSVRIPGFSAHDLLSCLAGLGSGNVWGDDSEYLEQLPAGATTYDVYGLRESNPWGMNFTSKGRRVVSWLAQLGYKLPNTIEGSYASNMKYDCLALLAFWKFYLDWVVPSRFVLSNPDFVYIKNVIDNIDCQNENYVFLDKPIDECLSLEISLIPFLKVPTAFLDDDFYTTAFQNSYGVENSSSAFVSGTQAVIPGLEVSAGVNPNITTYATTDASLSIPGQTIDQIGLLALGRLQRLVDTKKITSTSVLDWLRANYGIAPSHDALHLSHYLGSFDSQIMVGDVMATATTDTQLGTTVVGQYAGKGLGGSSAKWRVHSNSFGIVFVTAEISTKSSYVNGVSPLRRRFTPLSFYNEKFDNVGVRAIYHSELVYNTFESPDTMIDPSLYPSLTDIFGYQPRYAEYKHKDDIVSGDFMFPSVNAGLDSWYLARKFKLTDTPKIGLEFLSATSDSVGSQYDRIFQNTDNVDHFYSVYQLKVRATSLMEKLFDYFKSVNDTDIDKDNLDVNIN